MLAHLAPQHRAALTLRYLDGLSVPEAAGVLDRGVAATEALLVRARREFRHVYEGSQRWLNPRTDPFDALRAPVTPLAPDPALRRRPA